MGLIMLSKANNKYSFYYVPNTASTGSLDTNDKYTIHGELVYFTA